MTFTSSLPGSSPSFTLKGQPRAKFGSTVKTRSPYTDKERAEAWELCATTVKDHSEQMLKRWEDEINMLLTFAGLFSAALTAFNVQSYLLLQPDSGDETVLALAHISAQLTSFSVNQAFVNSTVAAFVPPSSAFVAPLSAIWINALWFTSLICTLSASSIAVTVKQWLYQYKQGLSGTSREISRLRQYRYDNLLSWRVPEIIASLPVLLQIALSLFLGGLLILLWTLHPVVALLSSVLVGALFSFQALTTLLPTFRPDCSYQSPQALGVFLALQPLRNALIRATKAASSHLTCGPFAEIQRGIAALSRVWHVLRDAALPARGTHRSSWHAREKAAAHARRAELDRALVMSAYDATLVERVLHTALGPCMWDMRPTCVNRCFEDVFGAGARLRKHPWLQRAGDDDERADGSETGEKSWGPAASLVLNFALLSARDSEGVVGTGQDAPQEMVLAMPIPEAPAHSELGGLFLQTMAHLVTRSQHARRAFDKMVWYLYMFGLKDDAAVRLDVIHDVVAAFPKNTSTLRRVVDYDSQHLNLPYLSVAADVLTYLARHPAITSEDTLASEPRIRDTLAAVRAFVRFPAWRGRRARLQYVLWELHDSGLVPALVALRMDPQTRDAVDGALVAACRALLDVIDAELLSDSWLREFWKEKFGAVDGALSRLEGTFDPAELEVQDADREDNCEDTEEENPSDTVTAFPSLHLSFYEKQAPRSPVIAYPLSAALAIHHGASESVESLSLPGPVIARPNQYFLAPLTSRSQRSELTAVPPGSMIAAPSSLCLAPATPGGEDALFTGLDRREWYRQQNATSVTITASSFYSRP